MKVLEERIAMDLVVLNIISILALMFFPMKTKGKKFFVFLLNIFSIESCFKVDSVVWFSS